jgi:hypothetical protein
MMARCAHYHQFITVPPENAQRFQKPAGCFQELQAAGTLFVGNVSRRKGLHVAAH